MKVLDIIFALLRFEICGTELCNDIKNSITSDIFPQLYQLSKKHDLAHLIADALDRNGLFPEESEAKKHFLHERNMAVYRYEQIQYEYERICETLENAKIPFMPLKGSVIRAYYPEPWMRTSCDIDVLIHEEDLQNAIEVLKSELNYNYSSLWSHDAHLYSAGGVHFELHYLLIEDEESPQFEFLSKIWEWTNVRNGYRFMREMTNEMFYFYHIAHMIKHFEKGGCGIRPFIDLWLLDSKLEYDEDKRSALLSQGGGLAFSLAARDVSKVWFSGEEHTELTRRIEKYVLFGGTYGNIKNRVIVEQNKKGGKFRYAMSRIFLPYDVIKFQYPILEKHRWLMPLCQVRRWFKLVFKGSFKKSVNEFKINSDVGSQETNELADLFDKLGL